MNQFYQKCLESKCSYQRILIEYKIQRNMDKRILHTTYWLNIKATAFKCIYYLVLQQQQ